MGKTRERVEKKVGKRLDRGGNEVETRWECGEIGGKEVGMRLPVKKR